MATAPGFYEIAVFADETMGETDPRLAKLPAAATADVEPGGPTNKRQPIRIVLDPDERPVGKGLLCWQSQGFNLQAATQVEAITCNGTTPVVRGAGLVEVKLLE